MVSGRRVERVASRSSRLRATAITAATEFDLTAYDHTEEYPEESTNEDEDPSDDEHGQIALGWFLEVAGVSCAAVDQARDFLLSKSHIAKEKESIIQK